MRANPTNNSPRRGHICRRTAIAFGPQVPAPLNGERVRVRGGTASQTEQFDRLERSADIFPHRSSVELLTPLPVEGRGSRTRNVDVAFRRVGSAQTALTFVTLCLCLLLSSCTQK